MAADILIVDDEEDIRQLVAGILEDEGHGARLARDSDEAIKAVEARRPQLILLDIWLQGSKLDGLQLLEAIKRQHPNVPVVMISGHGNVETAVTAIKLGAYDFIEKPFKADRLILVDGAGAGDFAPQAGSQRPSRPRRLCRPDGRLVVGDPQSQAGHRKARTGQLAHSHFRRRRIGQGTGRPAHSRKFGARRRSLRRHQRAGDGA